MKIYHKGKEILSGDDLSMKMVYKNITGVNFKHLISHKYYLKHISDMYFDGERLDSKDFKLTN